MITFTLKVDQASVSERGGHVFFTCIDPSHMLDDGVPIDDPAEALAWAKSVGGEIVVHLSVP